MLSNENVADYSPLYDYTDAAIQDRVEQLFTSIPGYIVEFNPPFAVVQPGIKRIHRPSGEIITPPPIVEVPVVVYGGKSFYVEPELPAGTECLILFSQRTIDGWAQSGGIAEKNNERIMDENDAMCIPGIRSLANQPKSYANNGIRIRNEEGDQYFWLKNDGTGEIKVPNLTINSETTHNGNLTLNGNLTQSGSQDVTGDVTISGTLKAATINALKGMIAKGINMVTHKHGGVDPGPGVSGGPQ